MSHDRDTDSLPPHGKGLSILLPWDVANHLSRVGLLVGESNPVELIRLSLLRLEESHAREAPPS